jgi:CubicO group peptidase (beta-lactamase class C family)
MIKRQLYLLTLALACAAELCAQDWSELRQAVRSEMQEKQMPGAAVAVIAGDRVVFNEGFGLANVQSKTAVQSDTRFRIGSVAKMFTAAAILSRPEADLQAPVSKFVPSLPPKLGALTLDQLLSHRAGMVDRFDEAEWSDRDVFLPPGSTFSYSSLGYALAGRAAAAAAGVPFEELLAQTLFEKLGMTSTSYEETTTPAATGYRLHKGKFVAAPVITDARFRPAGFLYSTTGDMARFAVAFMNGGVAPEVVQAMSRRRSGFPHDARHYGYGTFVWDEGGEVVIAHPGDEPGGSAMLKMIPSRHCAVIVLTNRGGRLTGSMATALRLACGVSAPEEPKLVPGKLTPADAAALAGTYMNFKGFTIQRKGSTAILKPWFPWFLSWLPIRRTLVKYGDDFYGIEGTSLGPEPLKFTALRDGSGRVDSIFLQGRVYLRKR